MRRTQQNADRQRRRGVRSRLVACVAAVAMLVTSVAAGTAVAAELGGGDAADQTTQNTATLEQQGTDNTGDNNQTTTDDDGQADSNQSADADSGSEGDEGAADNGAADGAGTAESDVQSQGDAASKSANAVPAPQSVDADVAAQADGEGVTLLEEDFTGDEFEYSWQKLGSAGLTAAGTDSENGVGQYTVGVSGGRHGQNDYIGSEHGLGFLQLTDIANQRVGAVLSNDVVQSSLGLDVTFYQWQFGGSDADGIGFFLVDGNYEKLDYKLPTNDQCGGALGYSAINYNTQYGQTKTWPGVAHGVLGVGLDVYGNYSSSATVGGTDAHDGDQSKFNGSSKNTVTVRGAGAQDNNGSWTKGYKILTRKQVGENWLQTDQPTQNKGVNADSDESNGIKVNIHITPADENGDQTLTVTLYKGSQTNEVLTYELTGENRLPELIRFGFCASTGQSNDAHYIRGLKVSPVKEPENELMLTKTIDVDSADYKAIYSAGDKIPYKFTVKNVSNSTITDVTINDHALDAGSLTLDDHEGASTTLAPGQQVTFRGTHTLTSGEARNGKFTNTATATGKDGTDSIESNQSSQTVPTVVPVEPLGMPDHSKKIGDNGNGTYTLALDVTGKTQTSGGTTTTPVDVVMIIDRSSSMNEDITTSSKVTYNKVNKVVESDGQTYTDYYWDLNYPFRHEYQHAEQTSRPTDTYYVYLNGQYVEVDEQTKTVNGERDTSYQEHVRWMANGTEVDPSNTPFYTRHTSSSSMSRMDAVKEAAQGFVTAAAKSAGALAIRVGVVQFGNSSKQVIGLTNVATGASDINNKINNIYAPGSSEGTQPVDAFKEANEMLSGSTANKVVIFFTDGGPGGTTKQPFNNSTANSAINASKTLKDAGVTVWSVGVFDGADPATSINNTSNNSDTSKKMNAYMHATSSNYPNAIGFADGNRGQRSNAGYYQAASTSEQLNEIFQDIFHDSTKTQAYGNVSIVDELSQWAQVADSVIWNKDAHTGNEYPVTEGVSLEVKDADGNPVREGDPNYPNGVKFYYEPVADGATDTTGTVRAVFADTYQLQDKWTYTLKFDVKPTDAAYTAYAANEYKVDGDGNTSSSGTAQIGADGTNLYTDSSNTPKGGKANTSAGKPGFRSNKSAYVEYSEDGESQDPAYYDHPVLQVSVAPVVIGSQFGLREKKTVIGDSATKDEFHFTVTAKPTGSGESATTAEDAAKLAGWTACSDNGVTDGCYTASDSDVVYSFTNPDPITDGGSDVVRKAGEDKAVTFTPDMVGRTFTYVYAESGELLDNWYNQSDVKVWTVTATVDYADGTKSALQVTVRVYHGDDASGNPADTYVYMGENLKPVHVSGSSNEAVPTVSFTNTYVAPVSSLPLTGGDSTARTLLLAGGGVLLVAGVAWLLARRRRV